METIRYPSSDGTQVDAYCARPLGARPFPGLVVIHHAPGLDEETEDVVRRLVARGYASVAPYLYARDARGRPGGRGCEHPPFRRDSRRADAR